MSGNEIQASLIKACSRSAASTTNEEQLALRRDQLVALATLRRDQLAVLSTVTGKLTHEVATLEAENHRLKGELEKNAQVIARNSLLIGQMKADLYSVSAEIVELRESLAESLPGPTESEIVLFLAQVPGVERSAAIKMMKLWPH